MKLVIDRNTLVKTLAHTQSIVERRNTIPILSNLLLQADGQSLSISATDMDIQVIETVPATVSKSGAATAPAHTLYDIARKLPEGAQVEISLAAGSPVLTVSSGRSNFKLGCLPVSDFPQIASNDFPRSFNLASSELCTLIDRARFAMSVEETRYYLNGMYLHAARSGNVAVLRSVATDGHRLARVDMPLPEGAAEIPGVIIPRKTVTELRRLLDEDTHPVEISVSDTKIQFKFGNLRLTSKLIDGKYPDYEKAIPQANDNILEINTRAFLTAVDRVSTVASDKTRIIKCVVDGQTMVLSASSAESGSAVEEIEVRYDGPPLEIGFNARYLQDITGQIDGDACQLRISDGSQPAIVQDASDASGIYVLMPMRA